MKSKFAIVSLILGILSFIQLFGAEKACLAVLFGILALMEIKKEGLTGKSLAIIGIILGVAYIVIVIIFLPYFLQILPKLASFK